jgi:predicted RNase H-like HicB family nuclease
MIYDVYLQVKRTGCTHAHVPALPGCNWLASSPDAAWEQATAAIQDHLDWLRRYGRQAAPLDEPVLPQLAQQNNNPQSIPIQPASRSVWKRLERMQVLSFEKLLQLSEKQRTAVVVDSSGERWSARKVFRRYLEHEREHTHHIQKIAGQYQAVNNQT